LANYVPFARSNYFAVKDRPAFEQFCQKFGLELIESDEEDQKGLVGFLCYEESGIPNVYYDEQGESFDVDFDAELATHLQDGHVAVCVEIGYEKMRYLVGYAFAVNAKGETVSVNLDEIYERAKTLGEKVTVAAY